MIQLSVDSYGMLFWQFCDWFSKSMINSGQNLICSKKKKIALKDELWPWNKVLRVLQSLTKFALAYVWMEVKL